MRGRFPLVNRPWAVEESPAGFPSPLDSCLSRNDEGVRGRKNDEGRRGNDGRGGLRGGEEFLEDGVQDFRAHGADVFADDAALGVNEVLFRDAGEAVVDADDASGVDAGGVGCAALFDEAGGLLLDVQTATPTNSTPCAR